MSLRGWIGTPVIVLPFQLLAVPSSIVPLEAQQLATARAAAAAPAAAVHASSYDSVFDSLLQALPVAEQVATVTNLTIQRDAARFSLQSGKLYLLTPVGGRTVAAVFRGKGIFSFAPPTADRTRPAESVREGGFARGVVHGAGADLRRYDRGRAPLRRHLRAGARDR